MTALATMQSVTFYCRPCRHRWQAAPGRVEEAPELEHHPWRYFADCPHCHQPTEQAHWERSLLKAWAHATGPKTPEGIANTSKNLIGHPTPEEALRTRFNAIKHGLYARVAKYFPAKPGRYPQCRDCEYLESICLGQVACLKRTELYLKHQIAFETRDPGLLMDLRADLQSNVQAIIDDIIHVIIADGVRIKAPQWYTDKEGNLHLAEYVDPKTGQAMLIDELKAHPLLKPLIQMIDRNKMTLGDLGMTPKAQEDAIEEWGHLQAQKQDREAMTAFGERQTQSLERLAAMIERSQKRTAADPVLIEHQVAGEDDA